MQSYGLVYKGWMGLMLANMASVSVVKDYDKVCRTRFGPLIAKKLLEQWQQV